MNKEIDLPHAEKSGLGHVFEKSFDEIDDRHYQFALAATFLLSMSEEQRGNMLGIMQGNLDEEKWIEVSTTLKKSLEITEKKLYTIGLSLDQYVSLYSACHIEDDNRRNEIINQIISDSESEMKRDEVITTLEESDRFEMKQRHDKIIDQILEGIPTSDHQKVQIISGPFAAGKTEIVNRYIKKEPRLEIDLDDIRELLMEDYDPTSQEDIQRVREESWILSDDLMTKALESGRSVLIQTALHRPDRWLTDINILYAQKNKIDIEIYVALRPFSDCLVRNISREGRSVAIKDQLESMDSFAGLHQFIEKFSNIKKVVALNFFPLVKRETGLECQVSKDMYQEFLEFAERVSGVLMEIREKKIDFEVINQ